MKILITGLLQFDSGKTSLTVALTKLARSRGYDAVAVKPVSGHNLWNQFDTLLRSEKLGKLVGEDAYMLWEASDKVEPLEVISPFDIATIVPDIRKVGNVTNYFRHSENIFLTSALVRLSKLSQNQVESEHFVVTDNLEKGLEPLAKRVAKFAQKLNAKEITKERLARLTVEAVYNIDNILLTTFSEHDLVIIESFNNAASPTPASTSVDKVIVVAPGLAIVCNGAKYNAAVQQLAKTKLLEITSDEILDIIEPEEIFELKPRSAKDLGKPLCDTKNLFNYLLKN